MNRASTSLVVSSPSPVTRAFEEEFDYVYRTFRRLGLQPAEAEDLAQDLFVVLCRRWSDFQRDRPLRPWLVGIAHRMAMDHARKRSRREVATPELEQEDEAPGPEDRLVSARARQLALRALASLPAHHRAVLVRHELDGVSIRGIAKEWSIPFFTVAARLRRARLRFEKAVKRLQLRGDKRGVLLPAPMVLEAERSVPPVPQGVRAVMRERLTEPPWNVSPPAPVPVAPAVPRALLLVTGAAALGALLLVALAPRLAPRAAAPARPAPADPSAEGLARRLVAHWRFEDGPGSRVAQDSSGNGRHCLLHDLDAQTAWGEVRWAGPSTSGPRAGWSVPCPTRAPASPSSCRWPCG